MRYVAILLITLLTGCFSEPPAPSAFKKQYTNERISTAALSRGGTFALTADHKEVCLWNNQTKKTLYSCLLNSGPTPIELAGISGNSRYFYLSDQLSVSVYQLSDGKRINQWFSGSNIINDIAISESGLFLVLGYRSGEASVIDMVKDKLTTFSLHDLDINSVSITDDGQKAMTGSSDKNATLWRTDTGEVIHSFKHRSRVNHVDISPTGQKALSLDAINDRFVWNLTTNKKQTELNTRLKFMEFNDTAFSSSEEKLVSGLPNRKLQLWNTEDGELIQHWISHKDENKDRASVLAVSFIKGGVATITNDGMYEEYTLIH